VGLTAGLRIGGGTRRNEPMDDTSLSLWDWLVLESKRPATRRATLFCIAVLLAGLGILLILTLGWENGDGIALIVAAVFCGIWAARYSVSEEPPPETEDLLPAGPVLAAAAIAATTGFSLRKMRLPLAVGFALLAQWLKDFNPVGTEKSQPLGWFLYAVAAALAVWALLAGDLSLPIHPGDGAQVRGRFPRWQAPHLICLGGAVFFSVLAFITFSDSFQPFPLIVLAFALGYWILGIGIFLPDSSLSFRRLGSELSERVRARWKAWTGGFHITPWSAVWILAFLALCFLRTYRMDVVPPEMTSDHTEKLLDVSGIFNGKTYIFFANNGGREPLEFYLVALVEAVFGTGVSFLSLKIVSVADGLLLLPFIYLIGKELADRRLGLLAMLLAGVGFWPDLISRIGLRFPLSPLFSAITLYFFLRALRRKEWNSFLWAGLALGVGLYGYTPIRILPLTLALATGLFLLFPPAQGSRRWALGGLAVTGITALILFIPMMKYATFNPNDFWLRTVTRIAPTGDTVANPAAAFLENVVRALRMFSESDGVGWFNLVPLRPALDVVTGAFFHLGAVLAVGFALRRRSWESAFLTFSIPVLLMPSIMALALPSENPSLTRGSAVIPVVFVLAAFACLLFADTLRSWWPARGVWLAGAAVTGLFLLCAAQNLSLTLVQYPEQYRQNCQNASELGAYIDAYARIDNSFDDVHLIPYPYWVDGRLVSIYAGQPARNFEIRTQDIPEQPRNDRMTLFLLLAQDKQSLQALQARYPGGSWKTIASRYPGKDFLAFLVPPAAGAQP
jgi:hypothetical protein